MISILKYQFFGTLFFLLSFLTNNFLSATKHVSFDLSVYEEDIFGSSEQLKNEASSLNILEEDYQFILRKVLETYEKQPDILGLAKQDFNEIDLLWFKTIFYENKDFLPHLNSYSRDSSVSYFSCEERNKRRKQRYKNWVFELNKKIELLILISKAENKFLMRNYLKSKFQPNYY